MADGSMDVEAPNSAPPSRNRDAGLARQHRYACYNCTFWIIALGLLLLCILLPISFSDLEYYQMGFKKRKTTSVVQVENGVYEAGRYWFGPDYSFKKYQADVHGVYFNQLGVFSSGGDSSVGLEFYLDIFFTYTLDITELEILHDEMEATYKNVVESRAKDGLKNEAIYVEFEQFFEQRTYLEDRLRSALDIRLRPLHVKLQQFHIGRIKIPNEVSEKQLESIVQNELNAEELFKQDAQLERDRTSVEVNKINLEADRISRLASSEALFIVEKANAEALQIRRTAQSAGLGQLYKNLNFTDAEHKASFDYIRTLMNHKSASLHVTFLENDGVVQTNSANSK